MRAEGGGGKGKGKRREKKRKKKEKMGIKIVFFFFFFFFFFINVHAQVFSYAQWSFFKYIRKTVSRHSRSAFVCDQNFNGESIWRLVRAKYVPHPYFGNFFQISLAVLRIWSTE